MIKGQFAKNLHKAVSERGIKQVELAKVLEVPPTTVNGWMRGAHLLDIEKLMEICVNEFIADTIKAVKDAGVKKITVEF